MENETRDLRSIGERVMKALYSETEANFAKSAQHEVYLWLHGESGFVRATEKMFGRKLPSAVALNERINHAVADLLSHSDEEHRYWLTNWASRRADYLVLGRTWTGRITDAIYEYLHVDHDARHRALVGAASDLQKISALLSKIKPLMEELGEGQLDYVEARLERLRVRAEARRPARDQKNKAEHAFVRQVARISQDFNRRRIIRPVVVDNLQSIGAIRHQFDIRTIHRICKELTELDKKRAEIAMAKKAARNEGAAMANQREKTG